MGASENDVPENLQRRLYIFYKGENLCVQSIEFDKLQLTPWRVEPQWMDEIKSTSVDT